MAQHEDDAVKRFADFSKRFTSKALAAYLGAGLYIGVSSLKGATAPEQEIAALGLIQWTTVAYIIGEGIRRGCEAIASKKKNTED